MGEQIEVYEDDIYFEELKEKRKKILIFGIFVFSSFLLLFIVFLFYVSPPRMTPGGKIYEQNDIENIEKSEYYPHP